MYIIFVEFFKKKFKNWKNIKSAIQYFITIRAIYKWRHPFFDILTPPSLFILDGP